MPMLQTILALMVLSGFVLSLVAFATMGITLRRTWSRVFCWVCFVAYLPVLWVAIDLVLL